MGKLLAFSRFKKMPDSWGRWMLSNFQNRTPEQRAAALERGRQIFGESYGREAHSAEQALHHPRRDSQTELLMAEKRVEAERRARREEYDRSQDTAAENLNESQQLELLRKLGERLHAEKAVPAEGLPATRRGWGHAHLHYDEEE